ASGFSTDGRQRPGNVQGDTFDLTVRRGIVAQAEKIGPEYLQSSHFINSADAKVRELARRAVGIEADPWKKALKIERYVADAMRPNAHELLATADHVARTLEGDCTEYAMLTAAMCRAEGVPSRTAIGLVYGDVRGQPAFIFHMWTEVWVRGQWVGLDATLGRGGIGAAHLKVADQSWHNESSMTPLLSTLNLLGRVSIDVLRTE
ncbi:MAG: transglutaminase family protein, partial [Planctomycetota bacterium]